MESPTHYMRTPEVERGVPLPIPRHTAYDFGRLEVGDSIVCRMYAGETITAAEKRIHKAFHRWRERYEFRAGAKISVRHENGAIRLWRVG